MCKISVITVCYNASDSIEQTIQSVFNQSYMDYEYIFVDGKSTDNTLEIINHYVSEFNKLGIQTNVLSEKDSGIFNAMNKGIKISQGDWLIFLNAGDYLCDNSVFQQINEYLIDKEHDVVFGDVIYKSRNMYKYGKTELLSETNKKLAFCHQCVFIKRNVMSQYYYDEKYIISADLDFLLKIYNRKFRFISVDFPISVFELGGISNRSSYNKIRDLQINDIYYNNGLIEESEYKDTIKRIKKEAFIRFLKNCIKMITPQKIKDIKMKHFYQVDGWSKELPIYKF